VVEHKDGGNQGLTPLTNKRCTRLKFKKQEGSYNNEKESVVQRRVGLGRKGGVVHPIWILHFEDCFLKKT